MRKILIFFSVVVSCNFFVVGHDFSKFVGKPTVNGSSLGDLSSVYEYYKSGFDTIVEFTSLNEAINSIGESVLSYKGKAKNKFELLKGNHLESAYIEFVRPMFEGCNRLNKTLDLYAIPYINNKSLSNDERDHILNITIDELQNLQTKTLESSTFLKNVQKKAEEVSELLKAMDIDVYSDFGPNANYGKQYQKLLDKLQKYKSKLKREKIVETEKELTYIVNNFTTIDTKIRYANSKIDELKMQLNKEMSNVYAFALFINGTCEYLPHFLNFQHKLRRHLVPLSKKFGKACYEFHMTHKAQLGIN